MGKEDVVCRSNGILLSHKKRWNIAICDSMHGSWEYHSKRNKFDGKIQEPSDFTHNVGYKTESNKWTNKTNKQKLIDADISRWLPEGKGGDVL